MYDLSCEFDIEMHKQTYIHYLEVIIDPVGVVHYAVPSHQEYLINECMRQHNWTRQQLYDIVPEDYYTDIMTWLCGMTDCVSVWESYLWYDKINESQHKTLMDLQDAGLYIGNVPDVGITMKQNIRNILDDINDEIFGEYY